jgi:hypothetical protein
MLLVSLVIVACGSSPKRDSSQVPPRSDTGSAEPATTAQPATAPASGTTADARCLPLIGCGCFMQCSLGALDDPESGDWKVDYYDTMVMAKIEKYCAAGTCSDAFTVHTCQKTCEPSPLPGKCEIERGALVECKQRP